MKPLRKDLWHHPLPVLRVPVRKAKIGPLIVAVGGHVPPDLRAVVIVGGHAKLRVHERVLILVNENEAVGPSNPNPPCRATAANRPDDPQYIVHLVAQVITVSLDTIKLVKGLPVVEKCAAQGGAVWAS